MTQTATQTSKAAKHCTHCNEPNNPRHFFCPVCRQDLHNPNARMSSPNCCRHALYTTRRFDFCPTCGEYMNHDEGQIF